MFSLQRAVAALLVALPGFTALLCGVCPWTLSLLWEILPLPALGLGERRTCDSCTLLDRQTSFSSLWSGIALSVQLVYRIH